MILAGSSSFVGSTSPAWACEATARILVVEDSVDYATLLQTAIACSEVVALEVEWSERLLAAEWLMENESYDAVLLDLSLPDSAPLETIDWCTRWANEVPVIVLTAADDEDIIRAAYGGGAQDVLVKDQISCFRLPGSLLSAIARRRHSDVLLGHGRHLQ